MTFFNQSLHIGDVVLLRVCLHQQPSFGAIPIMYNTSYSDSVPHSMIACMVFGKGGGCPGIFSHPLPPPTEAHVPYTCTYTCTIHMYMYIQCTEVCTWECKTGSGKSTCHMPLVKVNSSIITQQLCIYLQRQLCK